MSRVFLKNTLWISVKPCCSKLQIWLPNIFLKMSEVFGTRGSCFIFFVKARPLIECFLMIISCWRLRGETSFISVRRTTHHCRRSSLLRGILLLTVVSPPLETKRNSPGFCSAESRRLCWVCPRCRTAWTEPGIGALAPFPVPWPLSPVPSPVRGPASHTSLPSWDSSGSPGEVTSSRRLLWGCRVFVLPCLQPVGRPFAPWQLPFQQHRGRFKIRNDLNYMFSVQKHPFHNLGPPHLLCW